MAIQTIIRKKKVKKRNNRCKCGGTILHIQMPNQSEEKTSLKRLLSKKKHTEKSQQCFSCLRKNKLQKSKQQQEKLFETINILKNLTIFKTSSTTSHSPKVPSQKKTPTRFTFNSIPPNPQEEIITDVDILNDLKLAEYTIPENTTGEYCSVMTPTTLQSGISSFSYSSNHRMATLDSVECDISRGVRSNTSSLSSTTIHRHNHSHQRRPHYFKQPRQKSRDATMI
jgi:hypothetical protein